ncbi:MAG: hypothetical protein CMJ58_17770 [Planctomycetaceae bacterium]|nr:hypothetical protein [Planctomycetaceae bacterium]
MRTCDLETDAARMRDAMDELRIAWDEASDLWNDDVSRAFCERFLEPLAPAFKSSLDAVARMAQLVGEMERECRDEQPETL